uniref:Uncharacterized protein n=1 Tax=Pyrodinium bahamense TaxID=73915 RepID=A0A7S0AK55_9DINO|mmetsp:Transcript_36363/g.100963  ORF Transcript_36363/g.100963 Transcript_36363/m.100963 type:complete len:304 (+) Transcript_36363:57-968(+)
MAPSTAPAVAFTLLTSQTQAKGGQSGVAPAREQQRATLDLPKYLLLALTGALMLFIFLLTLWSWLLNDSLRFRQTLCRTPSEDIMCGDGANFTELAQRLGRQGENGRLYGCSCEEGILADWACAVDTDRFSISYFISTAPGTGAMAALSAWPVLGMWRYGAGTLRHLRLAHVGTMAEYDIVGATLAAFQLFYGLFLTNTLCVASTFHIVSVVLFIVALVVHYLLLAYLIGVGTAAGRLIVAACVAGVAAVSAGGLWPTGPSWLGQYAFWLGECIGLSAGFSIAPILILFKKPPAQPDEAEATA